MVSVFEYADKNTTRTNKGHEQKLSWSESMRHCKESSHSSVKNLNSAKNYFEHGSYWTTSVRAAKFFPVQDKYNLLYFHVKLISIGKGLNYKRIKNAPDFKTYSLKNML